MFSKFTLKPSSLSQHTANFNEILKQAPTPKVESLELIKSIEQQIKPGNFWLRTFSSFHWPRNWEIIFCFLELSTNSNLKEEQKPKVSEEYLIFYY